MATKKPSRKGSPKSKPLSEGGPAIPAPAFKSEPKSKKLSALSAAAQILAKATEPLTAKQMIEAMEAEGLWTSPGGKTPQATLYSAILREISTKGAGSRFKKADRGTFTTNTQ